MRTSPAPSGPQPVTARARLGAELREIRVVAGKSQRELHGPTGSGHASNVENGRTQPSWDFIEKYLVLGGDARHLRSLYQLARTESDEHRKDLRRKTQPGSFRPTPAPQQVGGLGHQDIRRHYSVESREERYTFDANGIVSELHCTCLVRATSPGTVLLYTVHSYDADQREGVLRVEADEGCDLEQADVAPTGSVRAYLRLRRTLDPADAQPYRCSFRVLINSAIRSRPILLCHPGMGTRALRLNANFTAPSVPARIWRFSAENELSATIPNDGYEIPIEPTNRYGTAFDALIPGWCYGFAWQW